MPYSIYIDILVRLHLHEFFKAIRQLIMEIWVSSHWIMSDWSCLIDYVWLIMSDWLCLIDYVLLIMSDWLCLIDYVWLIMSDWSCLIDYAIYNLVKTRIGVFVLANTVYIPNGLQAGHCGWPKITCDHISHHIRSIRNFDFIFHIMAAGGHFGWPKIAFHRISRHLRSIRNFFFFICFTKWLPAAILDDRKSLSNGFLDISDQYPTFFLNLFSKWPPAAILEVRFAPRTIGFFHYMLSMAMSNMKSIGEFMTKLEEPQAFWAFLYKMAARGHFVFPIDAKNHKVIWDLNGYGEYEFDWWICDKVMACTSIGVRRRWRRRRRNQ